MTKREKTPDIDEAVILESLRSEMKRPQTLQFTMEDIVAPQASIPTIPSESSMQPEPIAPDVPQTTGLTIISQEQGEPNATERIGMKQRKAALEAYKQTFLQVPKIENRKPVFVSCEIRDRLDEIVRRLGGRRMSVSGLIENLARHHLEIYSDDIERWRKL